MIGKKHGTDFECAGEYLEQMEKQISWNQALCHSSATDPLNIENYRYIHIDDGKELTNVDLLDGTVDIFLIYVQDKLNVSFKGAIQNRDLNSSYTSRRKKLGAAIQTIYATSKKLDKI